MSKTKQPRIKSVKAAAPNTIRVTWRGGGGDTVDLTGVIARVAAFKPLEAPEIFAKVHVIDWGWAIGWTEDIDLASDTVKRIAEEQTAMTGRDLREWAKRLKLSVNEAADVLDIEARTMKNYRRPDARIPTRVSIACRAIERDPVVMFAHFRPRKAGRPRQKEKNT